MVDWSTRNPAYILQGFLGMLTSASTNNEWGFQYDINLVNVRSLFEILTLLQVVYLGIENNGKAVRASDKKG